jgi:hypothetical protein
VRETGLPGKEKTISAGDCNGLAQDGCGLLLIVFAFFAGFRIALTDPDLRL